MNKKSHNILIDTSPLESGHAMRGIGTYTRLLVEHLEKIPGLTICRSGTEQADTFIPDLVHYPYFDLFFATLPVLKKQPRVVTIHDVIPLKFPEYYQPGVKGSMRLFQQKLALNTVDMIITDSLSSKHDIMQYLGVPERKVQVVYLAANPQLTSANDSTIKKVRQAYQLPKQYILYVGDINYNKNVPQLIKSLKFLPEDISLVCVGKNFEPQEIPEWQWIETQIALSDVAHRVRFISTIAGSALTELSALYSGALAYVQPSLYEGFGLPVLEAMQCQTPVVATRTSSLLEVGGSYALFSEPDAESLATQVETITHWSHSQREEWIHKAYRWSQKFSWKKTAQQTAEIYYSIFEKK